MSEASVDKEDPFTMASAEMTREWPSFPAQLMAVPAVNDACDLATHLYQRSKKYKMVGVALNVAEGSLKTAVTVATPLAHPLLKYAEPLDEWACRQLDDVKRMVPAVTLPSREVLSATREGVLCTLAGSDNPSPSSLSSAVRSRAARLVVQAEAIKDKAVAGGGPPHRVLDAAHDLLDQYLPQERKDPQEPDVREGGLGVKAVALATKTTRGVCLAAHEHLNASCPLDPTPSHLAMECVQQARYRWLGGPGEEVQQVTQQIVVSVVVLAVRMIGAAFNLLLVGGMILVQQVIASCTKRSQKSDGEHLAPISQD